MSEAVAMLQRLYNSFATGDMDSLGLLLGDTHWIEASGGPYGGVYHGLGEVAANVFGPIAQEVEGFSATPDEILAVGDNRALALGHYRGQAPTGPLEIRFAHLATVEGGRIAHFEQFTDTHQWRKALAR